jgi:hypothetical protein
MSSKFKDQTGKVPGLQNTGRADELPLLISFAEFAHGDSPDNQKLHKKMNEASHEICKNNWRTVLGKPKDQMGWFEELPIKQLNSVKIPETHNSEHVWVMCCGKTVGRLIGYVENIKSRTVFRPLRLDTFTCYKH